MAIEDEQDRYEVADAWDHERTEKDIPKVILVPHGDVNTDPDVLERVADDEASHD